MSKEIDAVLSALQNLLSLWKSVCSTLGWDWETFAEADGALQAIALLEASQREAPVAEGERELFEAQCAAARPLLSLTKLEDGEYLYDEADDMFLGWILARRLAERPSVTNVSRERIMATLTKYLNPSSRERLADAIFALQLPAPGKAATWREFMDHAPKFGQRQDSMLEQLADLRLVANKLGFYDAADYLKGPLAEPGKSADEGDWVNVKDRLPTDDGSYLTIDNGFNIQRIAYFDQSIKKWLAPHTGQVKGVTHWQPLPKAPK